MEDESGNGASVDLRRLDPLSLGSPSSAFRFVDILGVTSAGKAMGTGVDVGASAGTGAGRAAPAFRSREPSLFH